MPRILFVEKEERTRALLQCRLAGIAKVKCAPCMDVAWEKLRSRKFDLIVWNTTSDPAGQINVDEKLKLLANEGSDSRIVALTNSITTKELPPCGGNIHIEHLPVNDQDLVSLVERNLGASHGSFSQSHADEIELPIEFEGIIAVSLPMRAVIRRIMDAAAVDIPVLITGETGTGKDLVAAAIHRRSRRKNRPYVAVNMGAMARDLVASEIFGRERRLHRRTGYTAGYIRTGQRGHGIPGRNRYHGRENPNKPAPRIGRKKLSQSGRHQEYRRGCPHHCGDQRGLGEKCCRQAIS